MTVIKSLSYDQEQIIKDIMELHMENDFFDIDPTYSKGNFYKNLKHPLWKFDKFPQVEGVIEADCQNLPLADESVNSIMFDPPFVVGGKTSSGKIMNRFGSFESVSELFSTYENSLKEFYRILKDNGILVFKCQDSISSGKQYLTHVKIINMAEKNWFLPQRFIYIRS